MFHPRDDAGVMAVSDHHGAPPAILDLPSAITVTPPLPRQPQSQRGSAQDEEEDWEIVRIVRMRRTGKVHEYIAAQKRIARGTAITAGVRGTRPSALAANRADRLARNG